MRPLEAIKWGWKTLLMVQQPMTFTSNCCFTIFLGKKIQWICDQKFCEIMRYFSVKNWGHFQYNEYLSRKVNSRVNFANVKSKIRCTFCSNFCRKIINFTYWVCHVASAKTNEAALFTTARNSAFLSSRMTSTCLTNSWTESSFVTS